MLMTDPRFARRGAAQKVIEWGIAEADSKQLPIYLESSLMARPLYERNGFRVVQDFTMDLADYGGIGVERVAIMIRMPRSA
jgi:GNAT superfamily N-acetyltransferase